MRLSQLYINNNSNFCFNNIFIYVYIRVRTTKKSNPMEATLFPLQQACPTKLGHHQLIYVLIIAYRCIPVNRFTKKNITFFIFLFEVETYDIK